MEQTQETIVPDLSVGYSFVMIDNEFVIEDNCFLITGGPENEQYWLKNPSQSYENPSVPESPPVSERSPVSKSPNIVPENYESSSQSYKNSPAPENYESSSQRYESSPAPENNNNKTKIYHWNDEETEIFFNVMEDNKLLLQDPKSKKKEFWEMISQEIKKNSKYKYKPTSSNVENRYKALLKKYRAVVDHNNKTGSDHQEWKYMERMESLHKERANVRPLAGCSSFKLNSASLNNNLDGFKQALTNSSLKRKSDKVSTKETAPKRSKVRQELVDILKSHEENCAQRENARLHLLQQQHSELQDTLNKLLEKLG